MVNKSRKIVLIFSMVTLLVPNAALASVYGACRYGVSQSQECNTPSPTVSASTAATSSKKTPAKGQGGSSSASSTPEAMTETAVPSPSPSSSFALTPAAPDDTANGKMEKGDQLNAWNIIKIILSIAVAIFGIGYIFGLVKKGHRS